MKKAATRCSSASTRAPRSRSTARNTSSCEEDEILGDRCARSARRQEEKKWRRRSSTARTRAALLRGVNQLADAVKVTSARRAATSSSTRSSVPHAITKDGVTVAKEIEPEDPLENLGARWCARSPARPPTSPAMAPRLRPCSPRRSSARLEERRRGRQPHGRQARHRPARSKPSSRRAEEDQRGR